jgi:hypothetical protein
MTAKKQQIALGKRATAQLLLRGSATAQVCGKKEVGEKLRTKMREENP